MKTIRLFLILLIATAFFAISADAQRRRTRRPAPKPTPTPFVSGDVKIAKEKVSNQISNVTKFIEVLGPIAADIERFDREARTKRPPRKDIDANEANKRKVIQAIRNLRAGLAALETDFKTKPSLRKFLLKIEGIAALSAQSESSAMAGRFVESGKPLPNVVAKLSDTLAAMP
jgi:hypothetical protein